MKSKLVVNTEDMKINVPEFQSPALKELIGQGLKRRLDSEQIPIERIDPDPDQPRHYFDPEQLRGLSETIQQNGLVKPLAVRPVEDGRYLLIDGERRYRASKLAGLHIVPVLIYHDLSEEEVRTAQLYEILHHEPVTPMEEARFIVRHKTETKRTWNELARDLGQSPETLMRKARLCEAPTEVQDLIDAGRISLTHAYDLLRLPSAEQIPKAKEVAQTGMTTRELERSRTERKQDPPPALSSLPTVIADSSSLMLDATTMNALSELPAVGTDSSSGKSASSSSTPPSITAHEAHTVNWSPPSTGRLSKPHEAIKLTAQVPGEIHALIMQDMEVLRFRRYADYVKFCLDSRLRETGLLPPANTDDA